MVLGAVVLVLGIAFPFVGGAIASRVLAGKLRDRLGATVRVGHARAGLLGLSFRDVDVGAQGATPVAHLDRLRVPYLAMFRRGVVQVRGLALDVRRGGTDDNVTALVGALRKKGPGGAAQPGGAASGAPGIEIVDGRAKVRDAGSGLSVDIGRFGVNFSPGHQISVTVETVDGVVALGSSGHGPRFGAATVEILEPLEGTRPRGYPIVSVEQGFATPLPSLALTGIHGKVHPADAAAVADPARRHQLVIDLDGSYGGARETLWTARGGIDPAAREGQVSLRAEQFSLGEIADVLPKSVLSPADTRVDAAFDVSWAEGAVRFGGDMRVAGLNFEHRGLASEPLRGIDMGLVLRGTAFPALKRVAIDRLEGRLGDLVGKVTGFVELAPGTFTLGDGTKLGFLPRLELTLEVPKVPCAKALGSLPAAMVPRLQGFSMQGFFGAEITTRIDYANLEALELKGKVGIDGCRVTKAPPDVKALVTGESIVQSVEVPRAPNARGGPSGGAGAADTETMEFVLGPENPDFVPYEQISPNLIASIMTTEDNGFFKHRGWVTSEFKTALRRNLQRGGFRGGASSITMQMVKNVLLSQEKTLSRKLQELFLVWYLEQEVPKERILELYFNAIEFGPRIYGIGPAARHYFGKSAADLTPLEGAFFSSILPSPKRRYIQYCHGAPLPPWDRYIRRILAKVHERGRIDDEAYAEAANQKLVFDRKEASFNERQCLDWVKKITARPEPEAPPDSEAPLDGEDAVAGDDSGPLPVGKLRRLFSRDARRAAKKERDKR